MVNTSITGTSSDRYRVIGTMGLPRRDESSCQLSKEN
jgi:hypothetical protein